MRIWNPHPAAIGLAWISALAIGACDRSGARRQTASTDSVRAGRDSAPGGVGGPQQAPAPAADSAGARSRPAAGQADTAQPSAAPSQPEAAAASRPLQDPYHRPPLDTVTQVVYTGWKYFNLNCARCHGEDVTGTTIAPHLIDSFRSGKVDHAEFWRVVHGSRALKGMPSWTGIIDDDKLEAIYAYIKGRSDAKIHPGRPAVKSEG